MGAGLGGHQPERRRTGREDLARVRFERDHAERALSGRRLRRRGCDDRLVAPVHTIEIPDGGGRANPLVRAEILV